MPKAYWIVKSDIYDAEKFAKYASQTPPALALYGGRFLARAGRFEAVEGSTRQRNTIIEFPSYQAALDCWHSEGYQAARAHRLGGAELDIVILEGCD